MKPCQLLGVDRKEHFKGHCQAEPLVIASLLKNLCVSRFQPRLEAKCLFFMRGFGMKNDRIIPEVSRLDKRPRRKLRF